MSKKLAPEVAEERHAALTEQHDKARARVQAAEDAWVCERTCAARQSTHTAQTCARHTCTLPPPPLVQGKLQRVMAATPPGQRRRRGHEENGGDDRFPALAPGRFQVRTIHCSTRFCARDHTVRMLRPGTRT